MCTPVCSQNKYYDTNLEKCEKCPILESCTLCGPGKNDCFSEESCNDGYEWDLVNPNKCKVKLTMDSLKDLGLNPNKKYFQAEPEPEPAQESQAAAVAGDKKAYSKNDVVKFQEEKTIIFETPVKVNFIGNPCDIVYTDPVSETDIAMTKNELVKGEEMVLPGQVEIKFTFGCRVEFLENVATLEREVEENLEVEVVSLSEPADYLFNDILEFNNDTTKLQFVFDTLVVFKSKKQLASGPDVSYKAGEEVVFNKNESIRFKNESKKSDEVVTNRLQFLTDANVNVVKAQAEKSVPAGSAQVFEKGASISLPTAVDVVFEEDTKM
jgi:hypothetical protein